MRFHVRKPRRPFINIVSMVDILAILLIFFIVTTTFKRKQPALLIDLPRSETAGARDDGALPLVVSVGEGEQVFLDGEPVALADLAAALRRARESREGCPVALEADRRVAFGVVVQVLDALKQAGVTHLPAFTQRPAAP